MTLMPAPHLVSICVCTYKRPAQLADLLDSLAIQDTNAFFFDIVVVDNDSGASAKHTVELFTARYPFLTVTYAVETRRGISFARNKAVRLATGPNIAFIDDDEIASPDWLAHLLATMHASGADAVFGPVMPIYPRGTPEWVIKSGFFDRRRFMTGTALSSRDTRTGNALVASAWCSRREPFPFDPELALSGGEDYDFFKWMERKGARFTWCDSAVVSECVPPARQTARFMLERGLRASTVYWQSINATRPFSDRVLSAAAGSMVGIACCAIGVLLLPFGFDKAIRALLKAMGGFGRLIALSTFRLKGY